MSWSLELSARSHTTANAVKLANGSPPTCGLRRSPSNSGVLITNRPVSTATPNIIDIAPTVLQHFGVAIPKSIDGKPLWKR